MNYFGIIWLDRKGNQKLLNVILITWPDYFLIIMTIKGWKITYLSMWLLAFIIHKIQTIFIHH